MRSGFVRNGLVDAQNFINYLKEKIQEPCDKVEAKKIIKIIEEEGRSLGQIFSYFKENQCGVNVVVCTALINRFPREKEFTQALYDFLITEKKSDPFVFGTLIEKEEDFEKVKKAFEEAKTITNAQKPDIFFSCFIKTATVKFNRFDEALKAFNDAIKLGIINCSLLNNMFEAINASDKSESAKKELAQKIFQRFQKVYLSERLSISSDNKSDFTIDLHEQNGHSVTLLLESILENTFKTTVYNFIQGRGSHSKQSESPVRKAIEDFCADNKYVTSKKHLTNDGEIYLTFNPSPEKQLKIPTHVIIESRRNAKMKNASSAGWNEDPLPSFKKKAESPKEGIVISPPEVMLDLNSLNQEEIRLETREKIEEFSFFDNQDNALKAHSKVDIDTPLKLGKEQEDPAKNGMTKKLTNKTSSKLKVSSTPFNFNGLTLPFFEQTQPTNNNPEKEEKSMNDNLSNNWTLNYSYIKND